MAVTPVSPGFLKGIIAQGIGQALWEECFYDRGTAQLPICVADGLRDAAGR
jgi:hypothetical protein